MHAPALVAEEHTFIDSAGSSVSGRSTSSEPALGGPALWTAHLRGGLLIEWRVHDDTPEHRARLDLP